MAVIVIALVLVMSFIVDYNAKQLSITYDSNIAYGPILMLISAIAVTCIPPAIKKRSAFDENLAYFENGFRATIK